MAPVPGSDILHRLIEAKLEKTFLSETTSHSALIFGIKHHLVDHYQVCSHYAPVAKIGPTVGATCFT